MGVYKFIEKRRILVDLFYRYNEYLLWKSSLLNFRKHFLHEGRVCPWLHPSNAVYHDIVLVHEIGGWKLYDANIFKVRDRMVNWNGKLALDGVVI